MRIDVALIAFVVGAPDSIKQIISRPGSARFRGQQFQYLKFERSQIDTRAGPAHFMPSLVNDQIANFDSLAIIGELNLARSSEESFDAILQLARAKRLRQVIVGSGFEPRDFVVQGMVGRQKQCGRLDTPIPDALEQLKAGHSRHRDVQNQAVETSDQRGLERGRSTLALINIKAQTTKVLSQQKTHVRIVVDDQKSLAGILLGYLLFQIYRPEGELVQSPKDYTSL